MRVERPAVLAVLIVGGAYLASLLTLLRIDGGGLFEALFLLVVLAFAFPLLAWTLTRRQASHRQAPPRASTTSTLALLAYLAVFALLVLGWGFSALKGLGLSPRTEEIGQLLIKLITMVALPLLLFGVPARSPAGDRRRNLVAFAVLAIALTGFQAVFGRGLQTLGALDPALFVLLWAVPACFLYQCLEAGLCEEVLFRQVLQEKLAAATGSQVAAVLWTSMLFGLAHAPGLWMRGGHLMEGVASASTTWALAYSVAMIAPAGVLFGVIWARTRCLWLVVLLHGTVDLLPQLAGFITTWSGAPSPS